MKPWPKREDYIGPFIADTATPEALAIQHMNYERARAEAAIELLRKLQRAATRFMATELARKHIDYGCVEAIAEALADVGDIP